jgi:signal transduction histidine kinase
MLLLGVVGAATAESKRVLVLHSFGQNFKPWKEYAEAIRAELTRQSPWPLDITDHSLVAARSGDENPEAPFVEYLRALFGKHPPDLVVSIGAPAAAFVQRHRAQLFANTPMVFTAVERRRVDYSALTENDSVVALSINYFAAFENILRLLPNTENIMVVVGTSPIEKFWMEQHRNEVKPFEGRIAFTWTNHLSFEEIVKHAAALPPNSAIFWELMFVDAAGVVHEGGKALARLHAVANAPIFSYDDSFFGRAIIGGPIHSVLEISRHTAAVAVRILGGEKAGDIKTAPIEFARPKFDSRELRRWAISEDRLPPGSEVHFRELTAWDQYRMQILGGLGIVLLQAAMIGWLLYERQRRRRSEAAAHELSGKLISGQEEERARLARELHDDVTQRLASLAIDAGREERNQASAGSGAAVRAMREGLVRLSEDVHALSYRLHPSILEDLGLLEALRTECDRFSRTYPTALEVDAVDGIGTVPRDAALCVFRIAQEGLRNIGRHAGASRATVSLRRLNGGLELDVSDNGCGFDLACHRTRTSLGHAGMRQRAFLLGGKVDIFSAPGHGTTVRAWIPLKQEHGELSTPVAVG